MSKSSELEDAGWVRQGTYSTHWKAPDDLGPTGRKWTVGQAFDEMTRRGVKRPRRRRKDVESDDET